VIFWVFYQIFNFWVFHCGVYTGVIKDSRILLHTVSLSSDLKSENTKLIMVELKICTVYKKKINEEPHLRLLA